MTEGQVTMPADVVVPVAPPLANVHGVALMHVGEWDALSGTHEFTTEDLAAAVAAMDCAAVRRPVLKFGHDGNHGAGLPALGSVDNIALRDEGRTLVGDYVGMPGWLATVDDNGHSVLASAYPDRSIEGEWGYRCQIGHTHPFVIHAVALLGVERPGIGTLPSLQDLAATYGVALSNPAPTGTPVTLTVRSGEAAAAVDAVKTKAMVALVPTAADAERLAVDGGLPVEELHLTLLFLGDAVDWDDNARAALIGDLQTLAGSGPVEGDGFALSVFNAGNDDQSTCIVLGVGGEPVDAIHASVTGIGDMYAVPDQHAPWVAHLSLIYTDDLTQVADLVDRTGPITFDRLRIAFAGDVTDIPLTATAQAATGPGERSTMPNPSPTKVSATVTSEDVRRAYYEHAPWSVWITEMQLDPTLQLIVTDDNDGSYSRVVVNIDGDNVTFADAVPVQVVYVDKTPTGNTAQAAAMTVMASTAAAGRRVVFASRAESRPGAKPTAGETPPAETPAAPPPQLPESASAAPVVPAAEPEPTPDPMEDNVSDLSDIARGLGLPDDAGKDTILAAIADKTAEPPTTPTEPTVPAAVEATPAKELVAASTGNDEYATELKRLSGELATIKAEKLAQAKASLFDSAVTAGKIKPADRATWEARYDKAPDVIGDVLASIAPGTAIPVAAAGFTGTDEVDTDTDWDAAMARLDGPAATNSKGA